MTVERNPSFRAHGAMVQGGFFLRKKPLDDLASGYSRSDFAIDPKIEKGTMRLLTFLLLTTLVLRMAAQTAPVEPIAPAARTFSDTHFGVSFQIPAGWNFTRRDSEFSTFHLDARSAPRSAQLRAVADLSFNPYPLSTFGGAFFYFSVTPQSDDAACAIQASLPLRRPATTALINGVSFAEGHDEHGGICIESRDEVYTAYRRHGCYRFDLVINTFSGGDAGGGARDMTASELDNIHARERKILDSVVFRR